MAAPAEFRDLLALAHPFVSCSWGSGLPTGSDCGRHTAREKAAENLREEKKVRQVPDLVHSSEVVGTTGFEPATPASPNA